MGSRKTSLPRLLFLLQLIAPAFALSTDKCSHDLLVDTISEMEHCITKIGTEVDFCQAHQDILSCSRNGLNACFKPAEVEAILTVQKAELRTATETVFSPSVYVDVALQEQLEELLNSCYYIPSKEEASKVELKRLYWLDYVYTDGNCSKTEIGQVQKSLESCMDKQTIEFQTQVGGIKSATSLREKVCKIMNKTYGRCFRLIYPSCFSKRDSSYLDSQTVELFREGLEVSQEPGLLDFSMADCLAARTLPTASSSSSQTQSSDFIFAAYLAFTLLVVHQNQFLT